LRRRPATIATAEISQASSQTVAHQRSMIIVAFEGYVDQPSVGFRCRITYDVQAFPAPET